MTTRKQQAKNTKQRLLESGKILMASIGYEGMKIEDICQMAQVSVGAFYHHFKGKPGLIVECFREGDDFFEENIIGNLTETDPIRQILEYIGYQLSLLTDMGIALATEGYKVQLTDVSEFFLSKERAFPQGLYQIIADAQDQGFITLDFGAIEIADELLLVSRGTVYNWCQSKGSYDLKEMGQNIVRRHLCYFQCKEETQPSEIECDTKASD